VLVWGLCFSISTKNFYKLKLAFCMWSLPRSGLIFQILSPIKASTFSSKETEVVCVGVLKRYSDSCPTGPCVGCY